MKKTDRDPDALYRCDQCGNDIFPDEPWEWRTSRQTHRLCVDCVRARNRREEDARDTRGKCLVCKGPIYRDEPPGAYCPDCAETVGVNAYASHDIERATAAAAKTQSPEREARMALYAQRAANQEPLFHDGDRETDPELALPMTCYAMNGGRRLAMLVFGKSVKRRAS